MSTKTAEFEVKKIGRKVRKRQKQNIDWSYFVPFWGVINSI